MKQKPKMIAKTTEIFIFSSAESHNWLIERTVLIIHIENTTANTSLVSHELLISEMKLNRQKSVRNNGHNTKERSVENYTLKERKGCERGITERRVLLQQLDH